MLGVLEQALNCGVKIENISSPPIVQQHRIPPIIVQYKPEYPPIQTNKQPEVTIHHAAKKGDDVSTGFGRSFGETTGTAAGCGAIIIAIIVVLAIIGFIVFVLR